jgi:acyl-CoA synthetase (AMP-forming)/AMP-acid ligase II
MNITEPVRERARRAPGAAAVIHFDSVVDYRAFDRLLDRLAACALDAHLAPGDIVDVVMRSQYRSFALTLALARIGIASRTEALTPGHAAAALRLKDEAADATGRVELVDAWFDLPADDVEVPAVPLHPGDDALCRIFATSGTTGVPKGVPVTHAQMAARIRAKDAALPLPPATRLHCPMGATGGYGFRDLLRTLWSGGTIVLGRAGPALPARIVQHGVTWLLVPPATLQLMVQGRPADARPFPSLAIVEVGGAHLPRAVWQAAVARVCPSIVSSYGTTENGGVACAPMADVADRPGVVGRLLPGIEVKIVDALGAELARDREGVIMIRGAGTVAAYYGDDDETRRRFVGGWFKSGDLGTLTADGMLAIAGRADERINIGGSKIAPDVIERTILYFPGVVDAAAFALPTPDGIDRVALAIVTGPAFDPSTFEARCRERLGVWTPQMVLRMASIPRNANGKVSRAELAALASRQAR